MMNKVLIIFTITLSFSLGTGVYATDLQNGISQYKWGDSASMYPGLLKLGEKGEVSYYSKPGEKYTIGNVSIDRVIYGFYRDQLFGVYLNIESIEVYGKLLSHMKSLYGLPITKVGVDRLFVSKWKQEGVTIKLKFYEPLQKMKLAFYHKKLSSELNAKQWEELDTSSFRFVPIEKDKRPEKFILFEF